MKTSRIDSIVDTLLLLHRQGRFPFRGKLPPVRELAQQWKCAPRYALAIVHRLAELGILRSSGGHRPRYYTTMDGSPILQPPPRRDPLARRHAHALAALRRNLSEGQYGYDSPLPHLAALSDTLGVGVRPLRAILSSLTAEGWLKRKGNAYHCVLSAPSFRRDASLYLAGHANLLQTHHEHIFPFIFTLENLVDRLGWGGLRFFLEPVPRQADSIEGARHLEPLAPPDHHVAAYIHLMHGNSGHWHHFFLSRPKIPVVLINLTGADPWRFPEDTAPVYSIVTDNRDAARQVALRLRAKGHSKAIFLDPFDGMQHWARLRAEGFEEVFGPGSVIRTDCGSDVADWESHFRTAGNPFLSWLDNTSRLPRAWLRHAQHRVWVMRDEARASSSWGPLFEAALEHREATAWVCANDLIAAGAMRFLADRQGAEESDAERRIEIVGFDNSPTAHLMRMSSYDFGIMGMAHLALSCLARPDQLRSNSGNTIVAQGRFVDRGVR